VPLDTYADRRIFKVEMSAKAELTKAARWGERAIRLGIHARGSVEGCAFQAYWRTVYAARAAFRARPDLKSEAQ
jgi:hypothetical protein